MSNPVRGNILGDKTTSIAGLALASVGYAQAVGVQLPQNQNEWISFGISVLIAILGLLAKR